MTGIAGGTTADELVGVTSPSFKSPNEQRVADALLSCMARWGLSKTTVEDVAREAGVSRATVYRLFPGGKQQILDTAAQAEVRSLLTQLGEVLAGVDDLEDCLVRAIHLSARFLHEHEALTFMREHEPVALEQILAFDRLDVLFGTAGQLFGPVLDRFMSTRDAVATGIWLTRLVVSYLGTPSSDLDLCDEVDVRRLVVGFVLPGLRDRRPTTDAIDLRQSTLPL